VGFQHSSTRVREMGELILSVGCKMVPNNEWPSAPVDVPIIGLKELPESSYASFSSP
jgi:hypothetical protein